MNCDIACQKSFDINKPVFTYSDNLQTPKIANHSITRLPAPPVTHYPVSVIGGFDTKDEEN